MGNGRGGKLWDTGTRSSTVPDARQVIMAMLGTTTLVIRIPIIIALWLLLKMNNLRAIPHSRISIDRCTKNGGSTKITVRQTLYNSCYSQESLMDAKIDRQKCDEKQHICIVSKFSLHKTLITKGKLVTLQWRNLADTTLTKRSKSTSPVIIRLINIMYLVI